MRTSILLLAALLPAAASADEIFLKSGGRLSGRIVSRTASEIAVEIGAGRITVPTAFVVRIEEGRSDLQEYEERARGLASADAAGWVTLGEWASARGLGTQAREAFERALAAAPDDPRANAALGRVQLGGRWVSEDEGYRARGYVQYEGEWITPAEHEAILRERAAEEHDRERQKSETRVREAEERAEQAEAKAKQAEAKAEQEASEGLPLWYGWGAGPVAWPSGPIVTHPIAPSRPARPR